MNNVHAKQASEPNETHTSAIGGRIPLKRSLLSLTRRNLRKTTRGASSASEAVALDAKATTHEESSLGDVSQTGVEALADAGSVSATEGDDNVSIHEIDYDHEGLVLDANAGDESEILSASVRGQTPSGAGGHIPVNVAEAETEAEQYEIDWEEDGAVKNDVNPEATAEEIPQPDAMDVNDVDFAAGHEAQGNAAEGVDPAETDHTTHGFMAEHATPESDLFPDITVVYKGQAYPMFAHTADGFFSDDSLVGEPIKAVLERIPGGAGTPQ